MRDLLPCPFCRSTNLRRSEMYFDDDGEHEGIECLDCDTSAREDRWNQRPVCEWQWHKLAERMVTACGNDSDSVGAFCQFCGGKVEVV